MDRRRFLAAAVTGAGSLLAGCAAGYRGGGASTPEPSTPRPTPEPVEQVNGVDLPVPESELNRGAGKDGIPAITEPAFATDWRGVDTDPLAADDRVIGVERGGAARAYPLRVLNWHEVVNDEFGGPLLVTFCPLCGSGLVAERRVNGEATTFGVSGLLWNSDLVMYDTLTESLWSQIAATAIRGPATGQRLALVPASLTTWGAWRADHPDTRVLLPSPASKTVHGEVARDYAANPYSLYENSSQIGIGFNADLPETDVDLHPKAQVLGVASGGEARAYPLSRVREAGVVNDRVGELPVVVAVGPDGETLVAYDRRVDGTTREFSRADERHLAAAGSRWRVTTGVAVDGPHEGTRLAPAADATAMFWFAWLDFNPDTTVWGERRTSLRPADGGDRQSAVERALDATESDGDSFGSMGGMVTN